MNNRLSATVSRRVQVTVVGDSTLQTRWTEGDTFPTSTDTYNQMILAAGETFNFYGSMSHGSFLGWDNLGSMFNGVLDVAQRLVQCPNAFFDGREAVFCPGVPTDDVVAHEWSHGYTQSTSALVYAYQSGALNEAWSDIMGEVVDRLNGRGTDTPDLPRAVDVCIAPDGSEGTRWLMGEDATAFGGAIRDMYNPGCFHHPDNATSSYYVCYSSDSGGVHTNSGVINRFFAFLTDGAVIDGQTIVGVGLTKAAHIFWNAQKYYLSSVSDFNSVAGELFASCLSLVGTAVPDLSTKLQAQWPTTRQPPMAQSDCATINTIASVLQLRSKTVCPIQYFVDSSPPSLCPAGTAPAYFFAESFEQAATLAAIGWTERANVSLPATWQGSRWNITQLRSGREGQGAFVPDPDTVGVTFCQFSQSALLTLTSPLGHHPNHRFPYYFHLGRF